MSLQTTECNSGIKSARYTLIIDSVSKHGRWMNDLARRDFSFEYIREQPSLSHQILFSSLADRILLSP
jgi:hypothetical protein